MSRTESTQLPEPIFEVISTPGPRPEVSMDINPQNPDMVTIVVGELEITTVRANWTRIYVLLARIVAADELIRSFQAVTPGEWIETAVLP